MLRSNVSAASAESYGGPSRQAGNEASNLSIDGNGVLSATGGASYSEGDGIDITNNTISLDMDYLMGSNVALQHVTLDTPIEMLSGTKLTVETALQGLNSEKMTYKDNGILGAKNLLKVRDFTSITLQGITFTKQSNDTILMNGTNDGTEVTYLTLNNLVVPAGDYILSKGFTNANVKLSADAYNDSSWVKKLATSVNDDEVDLSVDYSGYDRVRFQFIIEKNTVVSNITAYPMLRLASDTDSTYRPYAMTNKELTDKVNEGIPTASASVLGGIKVGSGLSIDGSGVLSASGGGSSAWGSITGNLSSQTDLFDDLKGAETELRDTVGFTCKNRLPITLAMLKSKNTTGTWSDNAYTINGITYTVDYNLTDGYINKITANGTATGSALLTLLDNYTGSDIVQGKKYILNGCPDANNKCHITFYLYDGQSSAAMNTAYTSADVVMDLNYSYQSYARYMYIGIDQGYTASNVEFKPMIRKYGVADPTYERYYANVQSHLNHIDEWTPSQSVVNGQITFGGLDDTQGWGYKPYFNTYGQTNKNPSYTINSTSGEGTSNMSITYDTDADNGSYVKLRIIK